MKQVRDVFALNRLAIPTPKSCHPHLELEWYFSFRRPDSMWNQIYLVQFATKSFSRCSTREDDLTVHFSVQYTVETGLSMCYIICLGCLQVTRASGYTRYL